MRGRGRFKGLILAAGKGRRLASEPGPPMPKVLRPILGKPMVRYVVRALADAGVDEIALVVGYQAEEVLRSLGDDFHYILQPEQRGSGHAVACAKEYYAGFSGHLVVMCGDSPLFRGETVRRMVNVHEAAGGTVTLVTATLDDPSGYGRIRTDWGGTIIGIVEDKCATENQRGIREVNGGAYVFSAPWLFDIISQMALNEAGEYNLTDMVRIAVEQRRTISTVECEPVELLGVNTPEQLVAVEGLLRGRGCE